MKNIGKFLYGLKRKRKKWKNSGARFRGNEKRANVYKHISLYRIT
jgi:hypothetical protein